MTDDESRFTVARKIMVEEQLLGRDITNARLLAVMRKVPRHEFVPQGIRDRAYDDSPLPIGHGQTISQPYVVAFMTEKLEPKPTDRVLEVGTGSGYQAAVLGELAAEVWTIERHETLAAHARTLLDELGYTNVHIIVGDGSVGLLEQAPFDGIVVTAAAPEVPEALRRQLADGGRLVIPVGDGWMQSLMVVRRSGQHFRESPVLGCRFVPLIGEGGYRDD